MALADWFADADTVFLSASIGDANNWSALADDLSANDEDLPNVAADHADDTTHAATDRLLGDRCVEALVYMFDSGSRGYIVAKTDDTWRRWNIIWFETNSTIRVQIGDGASHSSALPDLAPPGLSGTLQRYWIAWSDEANPDATGPSDARLSTLRIWNLDTSEYAESSGTHAQHAYDPARFVVGAETTAGATPFEGAGQQLELVRISDRPRSRQEIEAYIPAVLAEFPLDGHVWAVRPGHVFFGIRSDDQPFSVLATDRSQVATDFTAGTTWIYETTTTRVLVDPRTIAVLVRHDEGSDTGVLYQHDIIGDTDRLAFTASDTLEVRVNNTAILTEVVPFLDSLGSDVHDLLVAWVTIPNPDATGASDAFLSFLLVANTDGEVHRASATHAATTAGTSTTVFFASTTGGASAYSGEALAASVCGRDPVQTLTELVADFLEYFGDVAAESTQTLEQPLPLTEASGVGAQGELAGLAPQWIGLAHRRMIRRHFAPIVNERFWVPDTLQRWADLSSDLQLWGVPTPGDSTFHFMGFWLFERPVPAAANAAYVQAHVRQWDNGGTDPFDLLLRVYSMDRWPSQGGTPKFRFVQMTRTAHDGSSGEGEYVFEGVVQLERAADGFTVIAMAFNADDDADLRFEVHALHVAPVFVESDQGIGGFGGG